MPRDAVLIKGADVLHNLLSLEFDLGEASDPARFGVDSTLPR